MSTNNYKAAYLRQKKAREQAETLLEDRSRELFESNESLRNAYAKLKDQKAQLLHQEKLAAIGQLSAGVAHEINNPAGYIKSNLNTLKKYVLSLNAAMEKIQGISNSDNDDKTYQKQLDTIYQELDLQYILEDSQELLDETLGGLSRIQSIVKNLKNFSRPDTEDDCEFDLNECILSTLTLVNNEIKYKAEVSLALTPVPKIIGQPGSMGQVILNLLINASHAIQERGNITVSSEHRDNEIIFSVKDDGCGIEEKNLLRIFDPFFSTKDTGSGTGLGLSVSHGIIKKHGGRMTVSSKLGKGTTFTVHLPCPSD